MTEAEFKKLIDPNKYQVFLFTSRAHVPVQFASHPWFVINDHGKISRWEIMWGACKCETRWGHVHKDALPPYKGLTAFNFWEKFFWKAQLRGSAEGELAERMGRFIEGLKDTYPYRDMYSLGGPNSNTFGQWVLDAFPEFKATLPSNSYGKKFRSLKKIKHGVIHGRFQPPHNGHIRYILLALEKCAHLTIGICTPKICTKEESKKTGYPCTAALNPFSHEDRSNMITLALTDAGISKDRYSIIAFPSDYKNIETLLPAGAVFLMSTTSTGDDKKIAYLRSLGFKVETIIDIPHEATRERSGTVRDGAKDGTPWEHLVPLSVARYLKEKGLLGKLAGQDTMLE